MSFGIGTGLGIAFICAFASIRDVTAKVREFAARGAAGTNTKPVGHPGRARRLFAVGRASAVLSGGRSGRGTLCHSPSKDLRHHFLPYLLHVHLQPLHFIRQRKATGNHGSERRHPQWFKEGAFLLSGARGIDIWLAPVPVENYGYMAQAFRVNELTGVSFWSLLKTELVALPILFILSLTFWSFIWHSDAVPSDLFPAPSQLGTGGHEPGLVPFLDVCPPGRESRTTRTS